MELYQPQELCQIITRSAKILEVECEEEGALELARRSRGTPRIANRLLKRVRDFALVLGDGRITKEIADSSLDRMEIDKLGLDSNDIRILKTIIRNYGGGPVGVETLAAAVGEETITIEDRSAFWCVLRAADASPRWRMTIWVWQDRWGTRSRCALSSWSCNRKENVVLLFK